jgi:uncharacterized membrane protein YuzA (DUF378 family)
MKLSEVEQALKDVEELLRDDSALSSVAEEAIRKLFNLVEALCGDVQSLNGEVDRLKKLLEEKNGAKMRLEIHLLVITLRSNVAHLTLLKTLPSYEIVGLARIWRFMKLFLVRSIRRFCLPMRSALKINRSSCKILLSNPTILSFAKRFTIRTRKESSIEVHYQVDTRPATSDLTCGR